MTSLSISNLNPIGAIQKLNSVCMAYNFKISIINNILSNKNLKQQKYFYYSSHTISLKKGTLFAEK